MQISKSNIILLIICLFEAITIGYLISMRKSPDPQIIEITKDSIIRDSIFILNEEIQKEIVYVKEQFTEDSIDIMSASDSLLLCEFTRYIENYNNK